MIKKMVWNWERLDESTERAKVIGGWVLRTSYFDMKLKLLSCSTVFFQDHNHEWTIVAPFVETMVPKKDIAKDFAPPSKEFPV